MPIFRDKPGRSGILKKIIKTATNPGGFRKAFTPIPYRSLRNRRATEQRGYAMRTSRAVALTKKKATQARPGNPGTLVSGASWTRFHTALLTTLCLAAAISATPAMARAGTADGTHY